MKLIIGTATFGSDYGIANKDGVLTESSALEILAEAQNLGISDLDTSPAYSNAEEIIGKFHTSHPEFDCYSKFSLDRFMSPNDTLFSLTKSLELMKVESLKGLYFHNSNSLLASDSAWVESLIDAIQATEKVEKVGASVYELSEVLAISERHPRISLFQVPENIADQRLRNSREIRTLHENGVEFHVRSVFLQGLLLMKNAPSQLATAQPVLDSLSDMADRRNCSSLEICMNYLKQLVWASKFIVGVSKSTQLQEIIAAQGYETEEIIFSESLPVEILDPRKWHNG